MYRKLLIPLMLLVLCNNTYAGFITYNGYTLNDTTNIVTDGTTEWLQWDLTSGQTINQALANYSADGWTLASNSQMANLFNTYGFGTPFFSDLEDGVQQRNNATNEFHTQFVTLFGAVSSFIDQCATLISGPCRPISDAGTSALFGSDNDDNYKAAIITIAGTGYSYDPNGQIIAQGATQINSAQILGDIYSPDSSPVLVPGGIFGQGPSGVALVRTQPIVNNAVPEPSAIALLCIALAGMGFTRRKKS
jgi:hypothetical protein